MGAADHELMVSLLGGPGRARFGRASVGLSEREDQEPRERDLAALAQVLETDRHAFMPGARLVSVAHVEYLVLLARDLDYLTVDTCRALIARTLDLSRRLRVLSEAQRRADPQAPAVEIERAQ